MEKPTLLSRVLGLGKTEAVPAITSDEAINVAIARAEVAESELAVTTNALTEATAAIKAGIEREVLADANLAALQGRLDATLEMLSAHTAEVTAALGEDVEAGKISEAIQARITAGVQDLAASQGIPAAKLPAGDDGTPSASAEELADLRAQLAKLPPQDGKARGDIVTKIRELKRTNPTLN